MSADPPRYIDLQRHLTSLDASLSPDLHPGAEFARDARRALAVFFTLFVAIIAFHLLSSIYH